MRRASNTILSAIYLTGVAALLLPGFLAAGCTALRSSDRVQFRTTEGTYAAGDEVRVVLENRTNAAVGYNLCFTFLRLERERDGEWESLPANLAPNDQTACTMELRGLSPGDEAEGVAHLPDDLAPGTYRISHEVEAGGTRRRVTTNPFAVQT